MEHGGREPRLFTTPCCFLPSVGQMDFLDRAPGYRYSNGSSSHVFCVIFLFFFSPQLAFRAHWRAFLDRAPGY